MFLFFSFELAHIYNEQRGRKVTSRVLFLSSYFLYFDVVVFMQEVRGGIVLTHNCIRAICSTMPSGIAFSFFFLTSKFISRWKLSSCSCVRS